MVRAPFGWYGGKFYMLGEILPLLPPHDVWVEAFAGAAWVTLAKPAAPVEVVNDVDDGIVNFYRVLRDPGMVTRLRELLALTPYARAEYLSCRANWARQDDPVEKARQWFVVARQSVTGDMRSTGWSYSKIPHAAPSDRFRSSVDHFGSVHRRLARVQIEHQDFRRLLANWDAPGTLLYCDPPYVLGTRIGGARYRHEMAEDDHRDLVAILLNWRGRALVSGYAHPLYEPLERAGWHRLDIATLAHSSGSTRKNGPKQPRVESLWLNYDTGTMQGQQYLFTPGAS